MSIEDVEHKTGRIALLCGTLVILGIMMVVVKTGGCESTPVSCKDEFYELEVNGRTGATCDPGAVAEVVNPPAAPKAGVLCHCTKVPHGTQATPPANP